MINVIRYIVIYVILVHVIYVTNALIIQRRVMTISVDMSDVHILTAVSIIYTMYIHVYFTVCVSYYYSIDVVYLIDVFCLSYTQCICYIHVRMHYNVFIALDLILFLPLLPYTPIYIHSHIQLSVRYSAMPRTTIYELCEKPVYMPYTLPLPPLPLLLPPIILLVL